MIHGGAFVTQPRRWMPSTVAMGGGIAGGTPSTTTLTLASALALTLTAAAPMTIVHCPFAQEVEDCRAEPHIALRDFE